MLPWNFGTIEQAMDRIDGCELSQFTLIHDDHIIM